MVEMAADVDSVRTLAVAIAADGPWTPERALQFAEQLAKQLTTLHAAGRFHGALSTETLTVDASFRATIALTKDECAFGATEAREWTHPELRDAQPLVLPTTLAGAHSRLQQASVELDPREIDVYQLHAVLCRLLTADSLDTYLRSPRAKARVPIAIRPLLDRAGSRLKQDRIRTMEDMSAALRSSLMRLLSGGDDAIQTPAEIKSGESNAKVRAEAEHDTSGIIGPSQLLPDTSITLPSNIAAAGPAQLIPPDPQQEPSGRAESAIMPARERPKATDGLPFQKLGHYQILDRIGCGGMGDVYRGYEQSLDRIVAIKVLPAELARQEEFVRRFRAEATAAARLVHPNIIQIYFIGEDSTHHFFAMQFVDGESLADMLARRGKLSIDETVGVMSQVLAGLAMAHRTGMVHRDIKPANILLDRVHNRALVADFGLVKSASNAGGKTATGVVMGTVDYIAPEQARAQSVDSRADLYSLGVLMYHMLTGQLPFEGDSPTAILFQHVYDVPKRVDDVAQDIPAPLASVVAKLLEKSPEQRYQTADEVLTDLRAFREGHPLPGLATSPAKPPARRQTAVLTLPWFEELRPVPEAAVEPPVGGWWERVRRNAFSLFRAQAPRLLVHLQNTQQQFDGAIAEYERRRDELQRLAVEAQSILTEFESQAKAYRAASAEKKQVLNAASPGDIPSEQSDKILELDRIVEELDQKAAEQREQLEAMAVRLSQVNATLNQLQSQRAILAARLSAAEAQLKLAGGRNAGHRRRRWIVASALALAGMVILVLSFVPSARDQVSKYATGPLKSIGLVSDQKTLAPTHPASGHQPLTANLVASDFIRIPWTQSEYMYTLTCLFDDGTVRHSKIYKSDADFRSGVTVTFSTSHHKAHTIAVAPDGDTVAIGGKDSAVHIWSLREKREVRQLKGSFNDVRAMKFSTDGANLLTADSDGFVCLWDVRQETELKRLKLDQFRGAANDLAWSTDEHRFLVGSNTHGDRSLSMWSLDSDQEVMVVEASGTKSATYKVVLGPEPFALSFADQKVHLWNLNTNQELVVFGEKLATVAFSRDARSALTMGSDRVVTLWNARNGKPVKTLGLAQDGRGQLAITPDGRFGVAISTHGELQTWTLPLPRPEGQVAMFDSASPVQTVAYSPDGVMVAYASNSELQVVHDPEHGARSDEQQIGALISSISFSPDGRRLLYGTGLINAKTNWMGGRGIGDYGRDARRYPVASDRIVAAVYHPDGSRVISACVDGSVVAWSAQGETELSRMELGLPLNGLALFPTGSEMLVAVDDNDIRQWNLDTRKEVRRLKGHTFHVSSVAVSEGGRIAVSGGKDRSVRTWDLATGAQLKRLAGHTGYVNSVAVSADGQVALSGSDDMTVRLWDTVSGEELRTFDGHLAAVLSVHISPDGNHGISGSNDGTVRVWDLRIPVSEDSAAPGGKPASKKN